MRSRLVLFIAIALAAPAFAGCFGAKDDPITTDSVNKTNGGGPGMGTDLDGDGYPEPIVHSPLSTTLTSTAVWVKPGEEVTFTATAPADAKGDVTYEWSIGELPMPKEEAAAADPHAGHGGGEAAAEEPAGHGHAESGIDTGDIAPGAYAEPVLFDAEGYYLFHCHPHPDMKFHLTVREGAPVSGTAHVAILDGQGIESFRFAPNELEIAPGTSIVFWNNGTLVHTATQESLEPITRVIDGATGPTLTYSHATDGDYRVMVTVKDAEGGLGKAQARLLVDSAKPDATKAFDPKTGQFQGSLQGNSNPEKFEHAFVLDFVATTFTAEFTASNAGGVPSDVSIEIVPKDGGAAVGSSGPAASGTLEATDVPAGAYTLVVRGGTGLLIDYEVKMTAVYDLVPPEPGAGHGGHGGGGHAH